MEAYFPEYYSVKLRPEPTVTGANEWYGDGAVPPKGQSEDASPTKKCIP